jgi:predicted Rossmann fold nucleotide-binding protein DprA/Smf involved in DNA uptake
MSAHIGVTGSRFGATPEQLTKARLILAANYETGITLHHGRCRGVDGQIHHEARALGYRIEQHPPQNRAVEDIDCEAEPGEIIHERKPYLVRDQDIVNAVSRLIVIPAEPEAKAVRSGTWATARMARRAGIPIDLIAPPEWMES